MSLQAGPRIDRQADSSWFTSKGETARGHSGVDIKELVEMRAPMNVRGNLQQCAGTKDEKGMTDSKLLQQDLLYYQRGETCPKIYLDLSNSA